MRYRLRYLHHDLELLEGQFVVGRSATCQLSLDDALVSRRHAMFVISREGVTVEDLQSRNGVIVNGQRITARVAVQPGDKVVIGSQELTLQKGRDGRDAIGRVTANIRRTMAARPDPAPTSSPEQDSELSMVRRVDAFNLLAGVAEKALAMGRAEEAERLLAAPLADVVDASRAGKPLAPALVDVAARFAAKLATATAKGPWADCVIELYQAQGRPCSAQVIDELYNAFRKVNAVDLARLRAYLAVLHEKQATFGPAERFLLQRIEGLERLAVLR
ncbi:MAG: FHA domain-containing protein [Polyangiaceae bacterium]|jgi:predicted component of type VI protein secretion system